MKFYSEKTKKFYDTYDECVKVEDEILKKERAEAERKAKLEKNRASAAKEVEAAFKAVNEAVKKRDKLLEEFVKNYGSFHMTLDGSDSDSDMFRLSDLFNLL